MLPSIRAVMEQHHEDTVIGLSGLSVMHNVAYYLPRVPVGVIVPTALSFLHRHGDTQPRARHALRALQNLRYATSQSSCEGSKHQ